MLAGWWCRADSRNAWPFEEDDMHPNAVSLATGELMFPPSRRRPQHTLNECVTARGGNT